MKIFKLIIITVAFILVSNLDSYSQNCYRQDYGFDVEENDEYVYENGSYYGYAEAGDTVRIKTVLYGRRKYKVFINTLEELQVSSWKIVQHKKRTELVERTRNERYEFTYKTNDKGEVISEKGIVLDEFGRASDKEGEFIDKGADLRIVTNKQAIPGSGEKVFTRKVINEKVEVYSGGNGSQMVKKNKKAKSVIIEIVFATGEDKGGCYGVFVGNQRIRNKKAHKK